MRIDRVHSATVTCPANVTQAAAVEVDLSFTPGWVAGVEIVIPPGHAGVTGLAIAQSHGVVLPSSGDTWIVGDDDVIRWDYVDQLGSGSWSALIYNLDTDNPHSWYVRLLIRDTGTPRLDAADAPIPVSAIQAVAGAGADTSTTGG